MRLEIILFPNALNSHSAKPVGFSHRASAPLSCVVRCAMKCSLDNSRYFGLGNLGEPSRTRGVLFKASQPQCEEAITPELHRRTRNTQFLGDRPVQCSFCGHLNNPSALHQSRGQTTPSAPGFYCCSFFGRQFDGIRSVHKSECTPSDSNVKLFMGHYTSFGVPTSLLGAGGAASLLASEAAALGAYVTVITN